MSAFNLADVSKIADDPRALRRSSRLLSRSSNCRRSVSVALHKSTGQIADQGLPMEATSSTRMDYRDLWQNAITVNRSMSALCDLFQIQLREERETLNRVYQCLEKCHAAHAHDAVSERKRYALATPCTATTFLLDVFVVAMLILFSLIGHELMVAIETLARDFINKFF